jgi:hypothetical protein
MVSMSAELIIWLYARPDGASLPWPRPTVDLMASPASFIVSEIAMVFNDFVEAHHGQNRAQAVQPVKSIAVPKRVQQLNPSNTSRAAVFYRTKTTPSHRPLNGLLKQDFAARQSARWLRSKNLAIIYLLQNNVSQSNSYFCMENPNLAHQ